MTKSSEKSHPSEESTGQTVRASQLEGKFKSLELVLRKNTRGRRGEFWV